MDEDHFNIYIFKSVCFEAKYKDIRSGLPFLYGTI